MHKFLINLQLMKAKNPQTLFLNTLIKPYRRLIYGCVSIDVLVMGLFITQSFAIAYLVDQLIKKTATDLPVYILIAIGGSLFLRPLLLAIKNHILVNSSLQLTNHVRQKMLDKLAVYGNERSQFGQDGTLAMKVMDEPDNLKEFLAFKVGAISGVVIPIIIACVVGVFHKIVALILLGSLPVFVLAMVLIGIRTAKKSREQMDALAQMGGRFLDWIRGLDTLRRLNAYAFAKNDIQTSGEIYQKRTMSVLKIAFLNTTFLEILSSCVLACVAIYLGFGLLNSNSVSFFVAVFVLFLTAEFFMPLRRLGQLYHAKSQAQGASQFLSVFLQDTNHQDNLQKVDLSSECTITFDKVCVKTGDRVRLPQTSFYINTHQKIAIMGQSGKGKTTILQTLLRFCDYTGSVKINNIELNQINCDNLRQQIAYLPQTPSLLPMSILDNLNLPLQTKIDENTAITLLHTVGIDVSSLPQGVHTLLGEQGAGLSGGQAKRLSIAQLMLQACPLWLIDEPTEHLDDLTKQQIITLINKTVTQKTVIWVTHDKLDCVDMVLNLDELAD